MISREEMELFELDETGNDRREINPAAVIDKYDKSSMREQKQKARKVANASARRHEDKGTLIQLFTMGTGMCPICGEIPPAERMALLSLTISAAALYRRFTVGSPTILPRRVIQAGAPPIWLYVCSGCHSAVAHRKAEAGLDALVSRYGVNFKDWQRWVIDKAKAVVLPAHLLRGGHLNQEYVAIGHFGEMCAFPESRDVNLTDWWEVTPPTLRSAVGEFVREVRANTARIHSGPTHLGFAVAKELVGTLYEESPKPRPTEALQGLEAFARTATNTAIRNVSRETLIAVYTDDKNVCQGCGEKDISALRVVCTGGEAARIRQESIKGFRRLFPRMMAQANYPGDVSILCADCHVASMRAGDDEAR